MVMWWAYSRRVPQGYGVSLRRQAFDADVAKGDRVVVAQQAEVAVRARCARVFFAVQRVLADFGDIDIENLKPVESHRQLVTIDGDFLVIPFADRSQVTLESRRETIQAPAKLVL